MTQIIINGISANGHVLVTGFQTNEGTTILCSIGDVPLVVKRPNHGDACMAMIRRAIAEVPSREADIMGAMQDYIETHVLKNPVCQHADFADTLSGRKCLACGLETEVEAQS